MAPADREKKMNKYTIQCTQADGSIFKPDWRLPYADAQEAKREYKEVFTGCKGWKVVKVSK